MMTKSAAALEVVGHGDVLDNSVIIVVGGPSHAEVTGDKSRSLACQEAAKLGVSRPGFSGWGDTHYALPDGRIVADPDELIDLARSQPGLTYRFLQELRIRGGL